MEPVNHAGRGMEFATLPGAGNALFAGQVGMLPSAGSRGDRAMTAAFNAQTDLPGKLPMRSR